MASKKSRREKYTKLLSSCISISAPPRRHSEGSQQLHREHRRRASAQTAAPGRDVRHRWERGVRQRHKPTSAYARNVATDISTKIVCEVFGFSIDPCISVYAPPRRHGKTHGAFTESGLQIRQHRHRLKMASAQTATHARKVSDICKLYIAPC